MAIIRRLATWLRPPRDAEGDAAIGEAFAAVRDAAVKLGLASFNAGARDAQERVEAICRLPNAYRFPRLALDLAKDPHITVEVAAEALQAASERADALVPAQPTESPTFEDGWAHTIH
jgi:hypothetical protein